MILRNLVEVRVLQCLFITFALGFALSEDIPPEPKHKISRKIHAGRRLKTQNQLGNPWESGELFESDIMVDDDGDRNGVEDPTRRWPNATIVYFIDKQHFRPKQLRNIKRAMAEIERESCVRFRPYRSGDGAFLRVRGEEAGCASFVGRLRGGQELNLEPPDCVEGHGTPLHELLHALGFAHQHSAPDRDKYIKILWENLDKRKQKNFEKREDLTDFDVGYDYGSVMHYSKFAGSKNDKPTIQPLDKSAKIGQRDGLSTKDKEKLRKMYGCVKKPSKEKYKPKKPKAVFKQLLKKFHNF